MVPRMDGLDEAVSKAVGLMLAGELDKLKEFLHTLPDDVMEPLAAITLPPDAGMSTSNLPEKHDTEKQMPEIKDAAKRDCAYDTACLDFDEAPIKMTRIEGILQSRLRVFLHKRLFYLEYLSSLIWGIGLFGCGAD